MKPAEAWRMSAIPYSEMAFKSILQNASNMWWGSFGRGGASEESGREDMVKRALRIARFDKVILAVVVAAAAGAPFLPLVFGATYGISASVTLSLAVSFALIVLYGVQTLASYMSGDFPPFLSTLPLMRNDVSLVNVFSFVRTSDYPVVGSVICQVFFVAIVTGSALAALFMLMAGVVNSAIAVSVSLWLSSVFYRGVLGSRRGGRGSVVRLGLLLLWGVAVVGIGVLFAATGYLIPLVQGALAAPNAMASSILSLVYPFSLGVGVGAVTHPSILSGLEETALAATVCYLLVAVGLSWWSARSVSSFPESASLASGAVGAHDTSAAVHGPVRAYATKDLRMASVNLPSAFLFALPAFETLVILLYRGALPTLRASTLLVAMVLGGLVTLILPLVLVSSEGGGFDFAKTLPLRIRTITYSKALIATAVFVPAVAVTFLEVLLKPLASPTVGLIPFASILAVAAASLLEVRLFLGFTPAGRAIFILQDFARMAAGAAIVILPAVVYAVAYVLGLGHVVSALSMIAVASVELAGVMGFVGRS